jgi:hypothetical protein
MGDVPGHEIEYPMAIVILGGLTTSTLLNLFVVPSLYLRFGRAKDPRHKAIPHDQVVQPPAPQRPVAEPVPKQRSTRGRVIQRG